MLLNGCGRCQTREVPDVRCQVSGIRCQVPGVRCQVRCARQRRASAADG
jgi:hypothetical protein